jgi:hypothetical protein
MQNRVTDEELKRYFNLFNGPLTHLATKALVALCGLEDPNEAGRGMMLWETTLPC